LPGDVLRCVVIARLPFSVPDDPLVQGRAERYDDPFVQFQLPQAALRLRQGFGRLIRTKTDYGAVVLLDRRVVTRDYGEVLLGSLPDARTEHLPLDGIAARVSAWCDRGWPLDEGSRCLAGQPFARFAAGAVRPARRAHLRTLRFARHRRWLSLAP